MRAVAIDVTFDAAAVVDDVSVSVVAAVGVARTSWLLVGGRLARAQVTCTNATTFTRVGMELFR